MKSQAYASNFQKNKSTIMSVMVYKKVVISVKKELMNDY